MCYAISTERSVGNHMTRDEILDAAAQILSQKGYHGTSMQDIAEAVHLQKASLYHHITNKQEILFDLLNRALDTLIERVNEVISEPAPPDERLRSAMRTYICSMTANQDLAVILLLEHRSLEPDLQARHILKRDQFEQIWRELILEGQLNGSFACEHPAISAQALLGAMNWVVTWFRHDGSLSASEISDQFADLFLQGFLTRR